MAGAETAADEKIDEYKLNIYGFADFTYRHPLTQHDWTDVAPSFAVGSFNLYVGAELGSGWRTLTEVRFMYLPNGSTGPAQPAPGVPITRTDTTVTDYVDGLGQTRWGGVGIQRAYLEKTWNSWVGVRGGQWLTPYGIWNVDHGSPVIIGVRRPYIIGEALFPAQQTGLEFFGSGIVGPIELAYHLTLSNGRGPIDSYADLDHNKAIGARVEMRRRWPRGTLTVGFSGYGGTYTDRTTVPTVDPNGNFSLPRPITAQYDELSLAADVRWEAGGFLFQAEGIMQQVAYPDGHRPVYPYPLPGAPPGYIPDHGQGGFYGITGYRFPFLGIMPWIGGEYFAFGSNELNPRAAVVMGGLNVRPTARVVLKAQYTHTFFPDQPLLGERPKALNLLDLQAAWSF
jgi:hypothetical protein